MTRPDVLRQATDEELAAFNWLEKKEGLLYLDDFIFFPLLLGGINLGYVQVDFYIRASVKGFPVGWRIRPHASGGERVTEEALIGVQEQLSTSEIVRVDNENMHIRLDHTLNLAIAAQEVPGT